MAAKGSDSKQVLIIALVVFVLLSIVLGITTYLGFDGQKKLEDEKKTASNEKSDWENTARWYKFQAELYRAYMGDPRAEDMEDMATSRASFDSGKLQRDAKFAKDADDATNFIRNKLDKKEELGWDAQKKAPAKTRAIQIAELTTERDQLNAELQKKAGELQLAAGQSLQAQNDLKKAQETLKKETERLTTLLETNRAEDIKRLNDCIEEKNKLSQEHETKRNEMSQEITNLKKQLDKSNKDVKLAQDVQTKLQQKIDATMPSRLALDLNQPKGRIESMDRTGKLPYVNLGSADRAKPHLTFRILGVGADGKPTKEKGSLEIVNVIKEHLSQARITNVIDPDKDPVLTGDLLYNPAWNPTLRQHVAIAGIVDLTGEKRDNLAEFRNNLKQMDIEIDAYLDTKEVKMVGEMGRQTDFLILGNAPDDLTIRSPEKQAEYEKKMAEIQKQAIQLGVTILPLREFLAAVGYRLPKAAPPTTLIPRSRPLESISSQNRKPPAERSESGDQKPADKDKR
jgi:hypothetical protein